MILRCESVSDGPFFCQHMAVRVKFPQKTELNKFYGHAGVPEPMNEKVLLQIYLYVTQNIG